MTARVLSGIGSDRRGTTVIEFAILAPVLMLLVMGIGDLLYRPYVQAILDGAVQKAGRDSTLESSATDQSAIDDQVKAAIGMIAKDATFNSYRENYAAFALIKPEPIYDTNGNGMLDAQECFDDINGNGQYDRNPARTGQGGAEDVTRYTVRVVYTRPFPVMTLLGLPATQEIESSTLLKNQPYKRQNTPAVQRVCLP
ncbi:TadE/TadG family type IV pilus assembly protein [Sphingomonas sp. SAFR-052]|uniref:TadE/TadG family type IV pilus assembly protein n=1 Tax=Sphingomonas sp. SAFR-052 TaxID=3436867 RepID=UPI003F7E7697